VFSYLVIRLAFARVNFFNHFIVKRKLQLRLAFGKFHSILLLQRSLLAIISKVLSTHPSIPEIIASVDLDDIHINYIRLVPSTCSLRGIELFLFSVIHGYSAFINVLGSCLFFPFYLNVYWGLVVVSRLILSFGVSDHRIGSGLDFNVI
jgi:hypothetical protein